MNSPSTPKPLILWSALCSQAIGPFQSPFTCIHPGPPHLPHTVLRENVFLLALKIISMWLFCFACPQRVSPQVLHSASQCGEDSQVFTSLFFPQIVSPQAEQPQLTYLAIPNPSAECLEQLCSFKMKLSSWAMDLFTDNSGRFTPT